MMLFLVTKKLPSSAVRMHNDVTAYIMRRSEQGAQQTAIKIHRKNDLNEAIVEKSPCI